MERGAVFLDKDGTLLVDVPFNADPALMELSPGAASALARLSVLAMPLFIVSNQSGVARGLLDAHDMQVIEDELARRFSMCGATLSGFYFCPHEGGCDCRKPAPGMLLRAALRHRLDLSCSWMVGDILDDIEAGRRAGCRTILVDNGNETEWKMSARRMPHHRVRDLDAAALIIAELSQPVSHACQ
jgi:D-glycero-D-manno-heptose 1,7-bisphosphate phosphatase